MDNDNRLIKQLIGEACQYSPGSRERNHLLAKAIRLIMPKLWKSTTPGYEDALQQTWIYFLKNACNAYQSDTASIVTWLNVYLKYRLLDGENTLRRKQEMEISLWQNPNGETVDSIDMIPDSRSDDILYFEFLQQLQEWVETDSDLKRIHISSHPEITAQDLILRRLSQTRWDELSAEFGIPIPTLSSFYRRQCLSRLQEFGRRIGYLSDE
jgi:DNA-directed RNA polymerase specialized sigma24 family protein